MKQIAFNWDLHYHAWFSKNKITVSGHAKMMNFKDKNLDKEMI